MFELNTVTVAPNPPARHLDISSLDLLALYEGGCSGRTKSGLCMFWRSTVTPKLWELTENERLLVLPRLSSVSA
jgi:hypothetical protein